MFTSAKHDSGEAHFAPRRPKPVVKRLKFLLQLSFALAWLAVVSARGATAKDAAPRTFNFENDISPLLTRHGCNASQCHGKAEGQNGFKLSVFGFDPQADWRAFITESKGRRANSAAPEASLFLAKASGTLPHQGGARIAVGSPDYETIRAWLAAGAPFGSANDAKVVRVELEPRERTLAPGAKLQLRVNATWSDGRKTDVTRFCVFQSSNDALARVDEHGAVVIGSLPGQTSIMARYLGEVSSFMAIVPRPGKPVGDAGFAEFNFIDRHVNAHLKKLNLRPSDVCDDATFLRRVFLDTLGILPTPDETRAFLADATLVSIRRLLVDDTTGHALDVGVRRYQLTDNERDYLFTRDRTCRRPGCYQPARRCEADHAIPYEEGGPSRTDNLGALCVRHHQEKTHGGWAIEDSGEDGSCTFVSPLGRRYEHKAEPVLPWAVGELNA